MKKTGPHFQSTGGEKATAMITRRSQEKGRDRAIDIRGHKTSFIFL